MKQNNGHLRWQQTSTAILVPTLVFRHRLLTSGHLESEVREGCVEGVTFRGRQTTMAGVQAAPGGDAEAKAPAAGAETSDGGDYKEHPLQFEWVLWHDQPAVTPAEKKLGWGGMLKEVARFKTVEDYWG